MKRFFQSGIAFLLIALLFFVTAMVADSPAAFICLGVFWMIVGATVHRRYRSRDAKESKL